MLSVGTLRVLGLARRGLATSVLRCGCSIFCAPTQSTLLGAKRGQSTSASAITPGVKGPDGTRALPEKVVMPRWPAGWHDHLQYHFFFEGVFVQARVFLTPSLEEHSLWIFDHAEGKVLELCNSAERMTSAAGGLDLSGPRLRIQDSGAGGTIGLRATDGSAELEVKFSTNNTFSWLPGGQADNAVIHRPDLDLELNYKGKLLKGRGYSKRYFGEYGPHWGYRFIQSSWLGNDLTKFLWTADATFRLGDGEAKYNYFKLLDGTTGSLTQANTRDTYQQDSEGYAYVDGQKYVASVTPLGEWLHDYKAGDTNSRMQLRYCKVSLSQGDGKPPLEGYALNERCFGVL